MESSGASTTDTDDGTEGGQSVVIEHEMDGEEVEVEDEDEDKDTGLSSLSNPASSDAYVDLDIEVEMDELDVQGEEEGGEEPSLGYLDQALSFIAAERAKLDAQRAAGVANSVKSGWKRVIGMYLRSSLFFFFFRSNKPKKKRLEYNPGGRGNEIR